MILAEPMVLAAWYHKILAFFFAALAILLMIVILVQRGRGAGLAGAFGGSGGSSAFGAKTGDILTWITVAGAVVLLTYTVGLNYVFVPTSPGLAKVAADTEQTEDGGMLPADADDETEAADTDAAAPSPTANDGDEAPAPAEPAAGGADGEAAEGAGDTSDTSSDESPATGG